MKNYRCLLAIICALSLNLALAGLVASPASAKPAAAAKQKQTPAQAEDQTEEDNEATANDEGSSSSSEESAEPSTQAASSGEPVSLLSLFTGAGFWGFLIAGIAALLTVAPVILPAIVWHGGNIMRGGKRPDVG